MYNQIFTLILFAIVTAFTPGPNNISAAYSGFNFGFKKTIPLMLGVIFGWTTLLVSMEFGLIIIFQEIIYVLTVHVVAYSLFPRFKLTIPDPPKILNRLVDLNN